jgi:hypothetical protein
MSNKLRVIQSNDNGFVTELGQLSYSGLKSFGNQNPQEIRDTLFIHKSDNAVKASYFQSVYSGDVDADGRYIFVTVTTPVVKELTDTEFSTVHLMSALDKKQAVVDYLTA